MCLCVKCFCQIICLSRNVLVFTARDGKSTTDYCVCVCVCVCVFAALDLYVVCFKIKSCILNPAVSVMKEVKFDKLITKVKSNLVYLLVGAAAICRTGLSHVNAILCLLQLQENFIYSCAET